MLGIAACGTSHYWARELSGLGHRAKLMPPAYVKPYVKRGKTDAGDAETIAEAVTRPTMRFVAIKSPGQQSILALHRTRDLLVGQRTQLVNMIRAQLAEFGVVLPKGIQHALKLVDRLLDGAAQTRRAPLGRRPVGKQAQQAGRRRHGQQGGADRLGHHDP